MREDEPGWPGGLLEGSRLDQSTGLMSVFRLIIGLVGQRRPGIVFAAGLLIVLSCPPGLADETEDARDLAEADKATAIWHLAEAEIIAERCPYASIDPQARAGFIARSHIDLEATSEDSKSYAFRLDDRRAHFWARSEHEMCLHGMIGYGPRGISVRNLMILKAPYEEK